MFTRSLLSLLIVAAPAFARAENLTAEKALERFTHLVHPPPNVFVGGDETILRMKGRLASAELQSLALVAESGVGKTAVVEALGVQLAPARQIYELDFEMLKAGPLVLGDIPERLLKVLENFAGHPERILFIDEAHRLNEFPEFMQQLKLVSGRPGTTIILATTPAEHRKYLENDRAFTRRFKSIEIEMPSIEQLTNILRANRGRLEKQYDIRITDLALQSIVRSVLRYYPEAPALPKMLDLMNEVMSLAVLERTEGRTITARLRSQLKDQTIRLDAVSTDLARAKADSPELKYLIDEHEAARKAVDRVTLDLRAAERHDEFLKTEAEYLRVQAEVQTEIATKNFERRARPRARRVAEDQAGARPPETGVHRQRGPGAPHHRRGRSRQLRRQRPRDAARVPDRDRRAEDHADRRRLRSQRRRASAREAGPRERGALEHLRNRAPGRPPRHRRAGRGPRARARPNWRARWPSVCSAPRNGCSEIDMNTLNEHSSMSLVGSGPGLVNNDEGGRMEGVRRLKRVVFLMDEIDKVVAHLMNIFHQPFQEGSMQDARGRKIDFTQAFVVATSNYSGDYSLVKDRLDNRALEKAMDFKEGALGELAGEARDDRVVELAMKSRNIVSSMYARLQKIVLMDPITPEVAVRVAEIKIEALRNHLAASRQWDLGGRSGVHRLRRRAILPPGPGRTRNQPGPRTDLQRKPRYDPAGRRHL